MSHFQLLLDKTTLITLSETESEYALEQFPAKTSHTNNSPTLLSIHKTSLPTYLTNSEITVIDSIKSGNRISTKSVYKQLLSPLFKLLDVKHTYLETRSQHTIKEFGSTISTTTTTTESGKNGHLIIFISGDTSISEFINGIPDIHPDIFILPIPQGTGNALSQSLNIQTPIDSIKALLTTAKPHKFQLYNALFTQPSYVLHSDERESETVTSLKFFVVGSWCLHSTLVGESDTPELRKFGRDRFRMAANQLLSTNPEFKGGISKIERVDNVNDNDNDNDGDFKETNVLFEDGQSLSYFVLAGVPKFEKTFEISPLSDPKSESLYLVYFRHLDAADTMEIMKQAYDKGAHVKNKDVSYVEIKKTDQVVLSIADDMERRLSKVCLDGTIVEVSGKNRSVVFNWIDSNNLFCIY
ncbi:unnamed protein product [Ambrosiozyma monospora]|uniref:Unnamed protein product n=1 Tax=Ambrosiozyma monospora TaxID=43982 RepID=A0ACB5T115_AMBMO|nr:unnamed protein product [Ambrosiozyma monospora]